MHAQYAMLGKWKSARLQYQKHTNASLCPPYGFEDSYFQLQLPSGVNAKGEMFAPIQSGHCCDKNMRGWFGLMQIFRSLFFVIVDNRLGRLKPYQPFANFLHISPRSKSAKSSNFLMALRNSESFSTAARNGEL
ncbi:hypothetical protein CEXT_167981 [Caerostris extrusa]|uniref:Uncharacterized protein n=1 Tax=Caerostris extrusa TaxID=172846 RepID=A0AAV4VTD4_CAEEX|nr:hypothetical protein CEXT_167981 [Caerostris extrusa]